MGCVCVQMQATVAQLELYGFLNPQMCLCEGREGGGGGGRGEGEAGGGGGVLVGQKGNCMSYIHILYCMLHVHILYIRVKRRL